MASEILGKIGKFILPASCLFVTGCVPGPVPPAPPGLGDLLMGWLSVILLIVMVILSWKGLKGTKKTDHDRIYEALNSLSQRIAALEDQIKNHDDHQSLADEKNRLNGQ